MKKQILLNAFNMNCVGHINHGLWAHPRDRSGDYKRLDYWTSQARTLERGLFDGLFIADIIGVYDVYQRSVDLTLAESIQLPVNDPLLLVSAIAAVTRHLGFGVTVNINSDAPFIFARRMSTLDHLTEGRIGWNIVTGYLDSAARALGQDALAAHASRYDQADDYLNLLYKLWEGSWDDDAVVADKRAGGFTRSRAGFARSTTGDPSIAPRPIISRSRRCSARRCFSRPAPRAAAASSPRAMRNASSSPRPTRRRRAASPMR